MTVDAPAAKLKAADFTSDQETRWCPGCGDYAILAQMQKVLPALGIPRENLVFVSGSAGRHPDTGQYPEGGIKEQTKQTLENIKAVLEEAGTSLDNVLKVTAFLKDLDDRPGFNEVYSSYFPADQPARTALGAGALGEGMLVEIEAIACIPD